MPPPDTTRVRFAPSPTGFLHVGGARTAIFNWLLARNSGGTFVLRIEDTDRERSSEEMTQAILDGLAWLGLDVDEGPHFQSAGRADHAAAARRLLEAGAAYRDFATAEQAKQERARAEEAGETYVAGAAGRALDPADARRRADAGEPFAVRFRVPRDEAVEWDDAVHGPTRFPTAGIEDFVLLRSDASPTYMLSVVCDDIAMRITDVIRGDDHLSNTPKQILLYRALDAPVPRFAHLPLILGTDKKRLSKRHGAVSVLAYRDEGYLADAMCNFLALLGWNPGDEREYLPRAALVEAFSLDRVGKAGAVFDLEKLGALNRAYLAATDPAELAARLRPALERAGLWRPAFAAEAEGGDPAERRRLLATLALLRDRARRLPELVDFARPFLDSSDDFDYDEAAARKHLKGEGLAGHVEAWIAALETQDDWSPDALETRLRAVAKERGIGAGKLIHPTRLAVTGRGVSPGIFEVLELIGPERTRARLRRLHARLDAC